jgi:hypothetical protein
MTEQEWLECADPQRLVGYMQGRRIVSYRKMRLFACASCRRVYDSFRLGDVHPALLTAEAFADGLVGRAELKVARSKIGGVGAYSSASSASNMIGATVDDATYTAAEWASKHAANYFAFVEIGDYITDANQETFYAARKNEATVQTVLVRDIFHNPFQPMPTIHAAWLVWNDSTIPKLAQAVYDERAFDRMPVLADALEEAGCSSEEMLGHCRGPGPHVKGCWLVDLLLGKE